MFSIGLHFRDEQVLFLPVFIAVFSAIKKGKTRVPQTSKVFKVSHLKPEIQGTLVGKSLQESSPPAQTHPTVGISSKSQPEG